jgi:hypothetical protein
MDKYYLTIDQSKFKQDNQPIKHSPKQLTSIKSSEINKSPSPKTLKKNISNENFIKYQWAWVI